MPQEILMQFAIIGAPCMGACSLLAHDYRKQNTRPGSLSWMI